MAFRFVHTADLHLDSPLASLALADPALAERVGTATRQALTRIVDLSLAEEVDALLIAGDLYDGGETSMTTAGFLAAELRRLAAAGVRVFLIRGNHDAAARITRELALPEGVHRFGARDTPVVLEGAAAGRDVAVHGVSFAQSRAPVSLLPRFAGPVPDALNIGLLHTSLSGATGHDDYAPVGVAELASTGFDYWALGHVHARRVHRTRPAIVMPGMPQGRDIGEAGVKSVTLAALAPDGTASLSEHVVGPVQFARAGVDIAGCADLGDLVARAGAAMEAARSAAGAETILRVTLTGEGPLAWRARADRDVLEETLRAEAGARGGLWLESLALDCGAPSGERAGEGVPVDELARLIAEEIGPTQDFREEARTILQDLRRALPGDDRLRAALGAGEAEAEALIDAALAEGTATVLARLRMAEGEAEETG